MNQSEIGVIQKTKNNKRRAILPKECSVKKPTTSPSSNVKPAKKLVLPKITEQELHLLSQSSSAINIPSQQPVALSETNEINPVAVSSTQSKENYLKYLAREFFLDCRQRLGVETFKSLLFVFENFSRSQSARDGSNTACNELINCIYNFIKTDQRLCAKFSAFLVGHQSLKLNLFDQTIQYEKSFDFLSKLDACVTNRCAFKKLVQLIIANSAIMNETDKLSNKIDEIKMRLKTITKNNHGIQADYDGLFDVRLNNTNHNGEHVYECISLVDDEDVQETKLANDQQFEFIDLTKCYYQNSHEITVKTNAKSGTSTTAKQIKSTGNCQKVTKK